MPLIQVLLKKEFFNTEMKKWTHSSNKGLSNEPRLSGYTKEIS